MRIWKNVQPYVLLLEDVISDRLLFKIAEVPVSIFVRMKNNWMKYRQHEIAEQYGWKERD